MARPPTSVRVAGMRYRIVQRSQKWSRKKKVDGLCWPADHLIEVNRTLVGDRKGLIVLHEVIHAAVDAAELTLPDAVEEEVVKHLARILYQVVRDNPKLVRYLQRAK